MGLEIVVGTLLGLVGFDMAQRITDRKRLREAEQAARDSTKALQELHNTNVEAMKTLTDRVNAHEMMLKAPSQGTTLKRF